MLKKIILLSSLSLFAFAESAVAPLNIKESIKSLIEAKEKAGTWSISDRNTSMNGESFTLTLNPSTDKTRNKLIKDLAGVSFFNELKYTKESVSATSVLKTFATSFSKNPQKAKIAKNIIDNKVIKINTNYTLKDYKYTIGLEDIDVNMGVATVKMLKTGLTGVYNKNDLFNQSAIFSMASLEVTPHSKKLAGEHISIKNFNISTHSKADKSTFNGEYKVSLESLDILMHKKASIVKNLNLDMTFGNFDVESYEKIVSLVKENSAFDIKSKENMPLIMKLLTGKGAYFAINDLSLEMLKLKNQEIGEGKISLKLSLDENVDFSKMKTLNPLMVILALKIEAHIELSAQMYEMLMQLPKGRMLKSIQAKEVNGKKVYDIDLNAGKLLVNGKPFGPS
jgi:hypothetical protein